MKSAEEIANDLCNEFPDSDIGDCWGLISKVIRAAQIDAAEWMRDEAAKVAWPATDAAKAIRSIKLPGDGE